MTNAAGRMNKVALLFFAARRQIEESRIAGPLICWLVRRFGGDHQERRTKRNEFGAMEMVCIRCGAVRYARKRRRFRVNEAAILPEKTPFPNGFNTIAEDEDHRLDDPRHQAS